MAEPSFIPKTLPDRLNKIKEPMGVLMFVGLLVFVFSLLSLGGLFLYNRALGNQVNDLVGSIKRLEADFDRDSIFELSRTAEAIDIAKEVLSRHSYLSNLFLMIEENTLPEIRYSRLAFEASNNKVTLSTEAKSYTALAHQREIFRKNPAVVGLVLNNFALTLTGGVKLALEITFNPALLVSRP